VKPVIFGLSGHALTSDERAFFREADPAGFILFGRNITDRDQLRALTDELRALSRRDQLAILIDQEGGRVARMGPPDWPVFPAMARFGDLYAQAPMTAIEAARLNAVVIGLMLSDAGITVNCAPVLDLHQSKTHQAIGDRSFGGDPLMVAALGQATLDGLAAAGVAGVIKHMPGQGRAGADSHKELPKVSDSADVLSSDLGPFHALRHASFGMTGHVVFTAWDGERPATLSPTVINDVIRGAIGFDGVLISDDLSMDALAGPIGERAAKCVDAGCDLALHCPSDLNEMAAVASALSDIHPASLARLERALSGLNSAISVDKIAMLMDKRDQLLAYTA
jgi:beta-N-acetylhexosaminidase